MRERLARAYDEASDKHHDDEWNREVDRRREDRLRVREREREKARVREKKAPLAVGEARALNRILVKKKGGGGPEIQSLLSYG
ncbi:hypothetical protein DIPPA_08293 [Diplonema papillatum]|nr:hypothetical protein DIPPA_08301 [Diplonema papillatum]KAJ9459181.1 hypothetical protein DIPPA_08293 [Diplonema papillatum]